MSFLYSCKTSQINNFLFVSYLGLPWFFCHPFFKGQSFKSMFIFCFAICPILPVIAFSQILKFIVCFISIDVINLIFRPFFCYVKPRQSVRGIVFPKNFYMNISTFMKVSSLLTNAHFWARFCPCKLSRFWVIMQNGLKFSMSNHAQNIARNDLGFQPHLGGCNV